MQTYSRFVLSLSMVVTFPLFAMQHDGKEEKLKSQLFHKDVPESVQELRKGDKTFWACGPLSHLRVPQFFHELRKGDIHGMREWLRSGKIRPCAIYDYGVMLPQEETLDELAQRTGGQPYLVIFLSLVRGTCPKGTNESRFLALYDSAKAAGNVDDLLIWAVEEVAPEGEYHYSSERFAQYIADVEKNGTLMGWLCGQKQPWQGACSRLEEQTKKK